MGKSNWDSWIGIIAIVLLITICGMAILYTFGLIDEERTIIQNRRCNEAGYDYSFSKDYEILCCNSEMKQEECIDLNFLEAKKEASK